MTRGVDADSAALDDGARLAFERPSDGRLCDETDVSLRAYVTRISESKLRAYDSSWSDEEVMDWDGNFREDGDLMLVCCERDVSVSDFREVLHEFLAGKGKAAARVVSY